jgi:translocation and assembly module TamA
LCNYFTIKFLKNYWSIAVICLINNKKYKIYQFFFIIVVGFGFVMPSLSLAAEKIKIEISGVNDQEKSNILTRLETDQASYGQTISPNELQLFYKNAPNTIKNALEPYGYFQPQIRSQMLRITNNQTVLHFFIQPGPPVIITHVDLQITGPGQNNPIIQQFIQQFPLKAGQRFNTESYEKAKSSLFEIVNNQGYLKATLEKKEIRINLMSHIAAITLYMNTGPRYYFGSFTFKPSPFDPSFLKRFIHFRENEPFSSDKLLKFQQDLNNSKYFQQVTVTPQLDQTNDYQVPTQIEVTAPKAQFYNMGIGYGTFTGPRITLGVDFRRVTDTGQHFNAQLKYSSVLKGLATKYFIPGHDPLTEQFTIGMNIQEFIPKDGKSLSESLSGSYVKTIEHWTNTFSLNLLSEHYSINQKPTEFSYFLYPSYNLSNITADDILNPRFGNAFHFTLQGSSEDIFSTTSFIQSEIKDKFIFSPTKHSRFILRGDLGYTVVNDLHQLPLTLNYFAGGLNSVRGYEFSSLGPGRYLEVASIEFQHQIIGNWNGAVFYDAGNASNHFNDPLMRGTGIGVVYQSMIGAIQVYLARAESKEGKPLSVEFTIGPDF